MTWRVDQWSQSASTALLSIVIVLAAAGLGRIAQQVVKKRLGALARRTGAEWDDAVVGALARRMPLWGLLIGVYIAADYWHLQANLALVLNKTLFVITAASLTFLAADVFTRLTYAYGAVVDPTLASTTLVQNIVRLVVLVMGGLIVLNGLGVPITPILGALGVGGLAVALALQDTLANLFAGFYMTLAGQLRVGDYLRLDSGQEGYLMDINWRSARIRMLPNNMVLVPNAKLSQSIVTNFYLPDRELAVLVEVGVDYDSDLQKVEAVTVDVARDVMRTVAGGVLGFEPFIRYHTFADSSINFSVIMRAREFVDQYLIKHEFVKRLHERYRREGIVIPFPIRTIVQRQGS